MRRKTVSSAGRAEYIDKKSRFLAEVIHAETEEEVEAFLKERKKQHYDARHHCSAYRIGNDPEIVRSRDDGEPAGSAGRPILSVLLGEDLHDTLAVVTRYFGGTLLGVGGLVKAYTTSVQEALKNAVVIELIDGVELLIASSYSDSGKLSHEFAAEKITVADTVFAEDVRMTVRIPVEDEERVKKKITEWTQSRAVILSSNTCEFTL